MENTERPNTVSGLKARRKELMVLHERLIANAKILVADIRTLDACIKLFDPEAQADRLASGGYDKLNRLPSGRSQRFVLDMLRTAKAPITSREIADGWIASTGLEPNAATRDLIVKRVRATLTSLRVQKIAVNEPVEGTIEKLWRLADGV